MGTVKDYIDNIDKLKKLIPSKTENIIKKNENYILDFNRDVQLFQEGINSLGVKLKRYSKNTINIKQSQGKPFDRTTLFDTGNFTNNFKLKINNGKYSIFSTDEKTSDLQDKYGSEIFGLTEINQKKINENLQNEINEFIKNYLL